MPSATEKPISELPVELERDEFMRELLRHLSGTLQDVVGLDQAAGFISLVGQKLGEIINEKYCTALQVDNLSRAQVTDVLVDLKRRILGDFYVISEDQEKIVIGSRSCPFAEKVEGRPSLCMITSNVFGTVSAENLGYAKVSLEETIAKGASGCRVVIYLSHTPESESVEGNEYFKV